MFDKKVIKNALGYWEIEHKPTPAELEEYYSTKYYQEARGSYQLEYSADELAYFRSKLEQRFRVVNSLCQNNNSDPTMIDVGCGEGYALSFFRSKGYRVVGIDFSEAGVRSKNPDCLDVLKTGDIFKLLQAEIDSGNQYELVWLQNVLEHVIDPQLLLKSLHRLVSATGCAVITVPNDFSITQQAALAAKHIDDSFWIGPPDHLNYFDHSSLSSAVATAGWQCAEMLSDFPVDWFLFHPGSNYVRDKSKGKAAHYARVQIENCIHRQSIDDAIRFWSSAAKLGIGRDITAFLKPQKNG